MNIITSLHAQRIARNRNGGCWIGVSDIDDDNIFKYTESKQVLNMTPSWAPGNPSNFWKGGDENCVEFAFVSDAKWNDRDCSAEQFSICESK